MQGIHTKQVAKYVILPGVVPRAKALMSSGFGYIAFLMANIYAMVRLLPDGHAYLNPDNIGRFGLRHVIAEAANHLIIKKENIDQFLVFAAMIMATILLFLQFGMVVYSVILEPLIGDVFAASLFETLEPNKDIAFMLMDHVFGVPDMFNSCVSAGPVCEGRPPRGNFPVPFQLAMQDLFAFYSSALLMVGVLIFLYFIVVVVVETAQTGTPFGNRFASIWVPIRLVTAIGLLLPVSYGYNSGQYIVLTAAKIGSGFATTAWLQYNATIAGISNGTLNNPNGEAFENLISKPTAPEIASLVSSMALVHTCAFSYFMEGTVNPSHDGHKDAGASGALTPSFYIKPYFVKLLADGNGKIFEEVTSATKFTDGLKFYNNGNIIIRFGEHNPEKFKNEKGHVYPYCGEIKIKVSDLSQLSDYQQSDLTSGGAIESLGGPISILASYFQTVKWLLWGMDPNHATPLRFRAFSERMVLMLINNQEPCKDYPVIDIPKCHETDTDGTPLYKLSVSAEWKKNVIAHINALFEVDVFNAWEEYAASGANLEMELDVLERGWGGAGIWYNKLAEINGVFISAVLDVPELITYPAVMEEVRRKKRAEDANVVAKNQFCMDFTTGTKELEGSKIVANNLCSVFQYLNKDGIWIGSQNFTPSGQNIFESAMNLLFGTSGLFAMLSNTNTHPLVQLITVGKGLVESAVRNMAISSLLSFGGGMAGAMQQGSGGLANAFSEFFLSTAFMGLTAGFVLFYVLPFLPFLYFYFAVASWLKTVFEAMVGVPLWALAHLRIDGEGLPGKSAENGYFLILEVFLRPILTVFGLIAAFAIFGAQVRVLHFLWEQVVSNISGFNERETGALGTTGNFNISRGIVDQFFFTIIYVIIVYMLAMASFKLTDRIPDNILRWMGSGVSAFSDINQETEVEGLTRQVGTAGLTHGKNLAQGLKDAGGKLGTAAGETFMGTSAGKKFAEQQAAQQAEQQAAQQTAAAQAKKDGPTVT